MLREILSRRRMPGVEKVAHRELLVAIRRGGQPVVLASRSDAVAIEDVARVLRRGLVAPDRHRVDPRVHLQAGAVADLDDVGEGVECRIVGRIVQRWLDALRIERVTAAPHLDDQGVDVGAPGGGDQVVSFARRADPFVKRIYPEGAQLGRIRGDGTLGADARDGREEKRARDSEVTQRQRGDLIVPYAGSLSTTPPSNR